MTICQTWSRWSLGSLLTNTWQYVRHWPGRALGPYWQTHDNMSDMEQVEPWVLTGEHMTICQTWSRWNLWSLLANTWQYVRHGAVEPLVLTGKHMTICQTWSRWSLWSLLANTWQYVRHGAGGAFGPYWQTHDNMSDIEEVEPWVLTDKHMTICQTWSRWSLGSSLVNTWQTHDNMSEMDMEQVEPLVLTGKHMTICQTWTSGAFGPYLRTHDNMSDMEQVEPLVLTGKHMTICQTWSRWSLGSLLANTWQYVRHGAGGAFGPYWQTHDNMSDMEQVEPWVLTDKHMTICQTWSSGAFGPYWWTHDNMSDMEQVEPWVLTDKHMTICQTWSRWSLGSLLTNTWQYVGHGGGRALGPYWQTHDNMSDMEQVEPLVLTDKHMTICQTWSRWNLWSLLTNTWQYVRHGAGGAFGPYWQTHDNMSDIDQVEPLVLTDNIRCQQHEIHSIHSFW